MENNNFNNRVDNYQPYGYRDENNANEYFEKQQEKKRDKNLLKTIGALCGFSIIVYFLGSTLVGLVLAFLYRVLPGFNMDVIFEEGMGSWAFSSILTVLFIGLPFLATHIILRAKKITGILPLGTTYNRKASACLVVMLLPLTLFSTLIINFISLMIQSFFGVGFTSGMEGMTVNGVKDFLLMTVFIAIIPAVLEEIAIRGILLQPLRRFGDGFAIVVSALIFSLLHGNMVQIPYTLTAGIYFGYVAVVTGSVWSSIILHFLNNFYSVIVTFFGSNFNVAVANILTLATLGLMLVLGIFALKKYRSLNYKVTMAKGVNSLKNTEKLTAVFVNIPMIAAIIIMVATTLTSISKI